MWFDDPWRFLAIALISLALLHTACALAFAAYFKAKERFVERLQQKMKGQSDGEK